jgi:cytochrome c-type biogenesis protein CcmH
MMRRLYLSRSQFTLILALTILLASFTGPVLAQEPTLDDVNSVAEKLNCPTCQSINLADCRTQTCVQWRGQIKDMLAEGHSEQQILDWYAIRYGDEVLQEPPRRGVGLYVWVLPIVGFLAGALWLAFILKKWSAAQPAAAPLEASSPGQANETDDYLQRVEQDLKNL